MRRYNLQILEQFEHGGFWIRVLATLIDTAVLIIPIVVVEGLVEARRSWILEGAVVYGVWAAYCIPFWSASWHATLGKRLCGLIILSSDGCDLTAGRALVRYVAAIVSGAVLVGPLMVAFTERRQGLHDLMANTVVVKRSALAKAAV